MQGNFSYVIFLFHTKLVFPCMQGDLNKSNTRNIFVGCKWKFTFQTKPLWGFATVYTPESCKTKSIFLCTVFKKCFKRSLLSEGGCHPTRALSRIVLKEGRRALKIVKTLWGLISRPILNLCFYFQSQCHDAATYRWWTLWKCHFSVQWITILISHQ